MWCLVFRGELALKTEALLLIGCWVDYQNNNYLTYSRERCGSRWELGLLQYYRQTFEQLPLSNDIGLLNTGSATHFHVQTGSTSATDPSVCSSGILEDLHWRTLENTHGSNHYPIIIDQLSADPVNREPQYIHKIADWELFYLLSEIEALNIDLTVDEILERRIPWWNDDWTRVNAERKTALRRYQHSRLVADKISYCRARATARYVKMEARRRSWQKYISTINVTTPMSKIRSRINKMICEYKQHRTSNLMRGNDLITDSKQVTYLLAEYFANISWDNSYSQHFLHLKHAAESLPLDFATANALSYNNPITIREIRGALKQCKKTAYHTYAWFNIYLYSQHF